MVVSENGLDDRRSTSACMPFSTAALSVARESAADVSKSRQSAQRWPKPGSSALGALRLAGASG
jgi:hypothetical protein